MTCSSLRAILRAVLVLAAAAQLAGCASTSFNGYVAIDDRECLARVMYFESIRSSEDGMLAVGTVVMNRLESGRYPGSVCGVVGQRNQFAAGALTKPLIEGRSAALARKVAANVLSGQRHPGLAKNVMFFHTYGYHFPYTNMRYVLVAGGNIFYYKDNRRYASAASGNPQLLAYAPEASRQTALPSATSEPPAATQDAAQVVANEPVAVPEQAPAAGQTPSGEPPPSGEQATDTPAPRAQPAGDASVAAASAPPSADLPTDQAAQ